MATKQFKLPDVGEGLTEGEILQWLVAVGDTVTVNQPLCEVETAKAAVELPSPFAGTVTALLHEAGDTVDVGTPNITHDVGGDAVPAPTEGGGGTADEPAAGLIGGALIWKQSRSTGQALAPQPTAAPDENLPQVSMPALGGADAFASIERRVGGRHGTIPGFEPCSTER